MGNFDTTTLVHALFKQLTEIRANRNPVDANSNYTFWPTFFTD